MGIGSVKNNDIPLDFYLKLGKSTVHRIQHIKMDFNPII